MQDRGVYMEKSNKALIAVILILLIALIFSFGYIVQNKKFSSSKGRSNSNQSTLKTEVKEISVCDNNNMITEITASSLKNVLNKFLYEKGLVYSPNLTKLEMKEVNYYAYNNDDESIRYYKINGVYQCTNPAMDCFYQTNEKTYNEDGTINYTKIITIKKEEANKYYLQEVTDEITNLELLTEVNEVLA